MCFNVCGQQATGLPRQCSLECDFPSPGFSVPWDGSGGPRPDLACSCSETGSDCLFNLN